MWLLMQESQSYTGTYMYLSLLEQWITVIIIFAIRDFVFFQFSLFNFNNGSSKYLNASPLSGGDQKRALQNQADLCLKWAL